MGMSQSKSEVALRSIVNSGISVVKKTVSKTSTPITNINEIDVSGCDGVSISGVTMKNYSKVDIEAVVKSFSSSELTQEIDKAMKAQAQASADAAIGIADADTSVLTESITNLSLAISEEVSNSSEAATTLLNRIKCGSSKNVIIKNIDMENVAELFIKQITESTSVTAAEQSLKEKLEAMGIAKAKGLDPTAMFGMAMIAAVIGGAFFLFGGVGVAVKILLSSSFWMLACGVLAGFSAYMLASTWAETWPSKKQVKLPAEPAPTPEQVAATKKVNDEIKERNKSIRKVSGIILPITGLGAILFGVMTTMSIRKPVAATPSAPPAYAR